VRGPDAAFVAVAPPTYGALPEGFWAGAPDLAGEVVSRSNRAREIRGKVAEYRSAGCRLVWVIHPQRRTAEEQRAGGTLRPLRPDDALDGFDVLPGFRLPLAELFRR
jgi:Uma2 family endonuclease